MIRLGLQLPHFGPHATPDGVVEFAKRAEHLGFDSLWVGDHVVLPTQTEGDYPYQKGGLPELDMSHAPAVYRAVMDPDMTLHYMAALIARDIQTYRDVAGFDISGNPGLTATLYNTGAAEERAADLVAENRKRRAAGRSLLYPQENFYGWLINDRLAELRKLLPGEPVAKSN